MINPLTTATRGRIRSANVSKDSLILAVSGLLYFLAITQSGGGGSSSGGVGWWENHKKGKNSQELFAEMIMRDDKEILEIIKAWLK